MFIYNFQLFLVFIFPLSQLPTLTNRLSYGTATGSSQQQKDKLQAGQDHGE